MLKKFFGSVRPKFFRRKNMIPHFLIHKNGLEPEILSKRVWIVHQKIRHCETKNFWQKNVTHPVMHEFFRYPKFSETLKGCLRFFSGLWDKNFWWKSVITSSTQKFFENPKVSETLKGCHKFFGTVRPIFFQRKNVLRPPLSSVKTFRNQNFSQK